MSRRPTGAGAGSSSAGASGRSFFVSQSTGNDGNAGTSTGAPWKTVAKVNATALLPGDTVYFLCGDTWSEALVPNGNGTYSTATYASAYTTQLINTKTAVYMTNGTYATAFSRLVAAGYSEANAASTAYDLCLRQGRMDAHIAALQAANAASSWITFSSYGSGAKPILDGGSSLNAGIHPDTSAITGGIAVRGLKIQNFLVAGIDFTCGAAGIANGFLVDNCELYNNTGMPRPTSSGDVQAQVAGFNETASSGLFVWRCDYVTFTSSYTTYNDTPFLFAAAANTYASAITADHARSWQAAIAGIGTGAKNVGPSTARLASRGAVQNSTFTNTGYDHGYYAGTSGFMVAGTFDMLMRDCEIAYTSNAFDATNKDSVGYDVEGANDTTTVLRCNIHDNQGDGFLWTQSSFPGLGGVTTGTMVVNCIINNNSLKSPVNNAAIAREGAATSSDVCPWMGNTVTRAAPAPTQKLWRTGASGLTDTTPTPWTFGSDNTVTN